MNKDKFAVNGTTMQMGVNRHCRHRVGGGSMIGHMINEGVCRINMIIADTKVQLGAELP